MGRLSHQEHQWEVAYRFFPGSSPWSVVGCYKEDHKPGHGKCRGYYLKTRKNSLTELSMQAAVYLTVLHAHGIIFLFFDCLIQPDMRSFALCFCMLFCCVWFLSIEDLLLSEGKQRERVL